MSTTITIKLPEDALAILRSSPDDFAREFRLAAAVKWYEVGRISQGRAAELAGMSRASFIEALAEYGVSPLQVTPEDVDEELRHALGGKGESDA